MKAIFFYVALIAIAVNLAGNMASNTAKGMEAAQKARFEKLCQVNRIYCR